MKRSSILVKMLMGISIPIILVLFFIGFCISDRVGKNVTIQAKNQLQSDSVAVAGQVNNFFTNYIANVEGVASSTQIESILKKTTGSTRMNTQPDFGDVKITLNKLKALDENILASWVSDFDTSFLYMSDGFISDPGWDVSARPWYQVANTKEPILTAPYVDVSTGSLIVSVDAPVFDHLSGNVLGACGYDISMSQLSGILSGYKIGEQGFLILCDATGLVIYSPNAEDINKSIAETDCSDELKTALTSGATGGVDFTLAGAAYSGSIQKVGNTGWQVLSCQPQAEIQQSYYAVLSVILFCSGMGLVLLVAMIYLIARGIAKPIKKLSGVAKRIAAGDLDVLVDIKSKDESGLVADALSETVGQLRNYMNYIDEISEVLNQIAGNDLVFHLKYDYSGSFSKIKDSMLNIRGTLTRTLENIAQTADQVAMSSDQVSAGAQALSQGSTEQASSIQELSATINEISGQVQQNAGNAQEASQSATAVGEKMTQSNHQMQELTHAMEQINRSSGEIEKIIKTIEDIAFQTNILALNAAVEAARAGSAGKGFAVVADEVRNLAAKSQEAARSTTALIQDSIGAVENGTRIADTTAVSLNEAAERTRTLVAAIDRISQACAVQAESISQVSFGVEQVSSVVQTNSATAEQSAAASEEMSGQAQILKNLVGRFRLDKLDKLEKQEKGEQLVGAGR